MIIVFSFFIFLFVLYVLSKDDFTFMRKNLSLERFFDMVFVATAVGLLFSRSVYVFLHPSGGYLNPLVFLLVWYFPGLSLSGFLLGGVVTVYLIAVRAKFPIGRLFDILALGCLFAFASYSFLEAVFLFLSRQLFVSAVSLGIGILALAGYTIMQKISVRTSWRDGLLSLIIIFSISLLSLLFQTAAISFKHVPLEVYIFLMLLVILGVGYAMQFLRRTKRS